MQEHPIQKTGVWAAMGRTAGWLMAAMVVATAVAQPAAAQDPLRYRLKWLFNISTAGDLWADRNDCFRQAGLTVEVKAGGPERDAIRELELGQAEFGVASADQVIRALAKGSPVVVVAQLFQVNPLQWVYRGALGPLRSLDDLRGKTIGVTFGGNDETILRTLLAQAGIQEPQVRLFSVRYDYTPFYEGRVDLWPVYRNAQGPIIAAKLQRGGEAVAFFDPADFDVKFVANSVVTARSTLQRQPELVGRFVGALLKGWRQALAPENRDEALALVARYDPDSPPELLRQQYDLTRKLVQPDAKIGIGHLDRAAWQQTEQILLQQGQIQSPVHVERSLESRWSP